MVAARTSQPRIARCIATVRGQRVVLDVDLAELYGVKTRVLLQAVRRNITRFPPDFLIRLTNQDIAALRSQSVISKRAGRGGRSYVPYAFTEHGAVVAATVLNSRQAIEVSIFVVRTIDVKMGAQDRVIQRILEAIRQLMTPAERPPKQQIGFVRQ